MVGEEDHLALPAIDFHQGDDAAQRLRVKAVRLPQGHFHDFVAHDFAGHRAAFQHPATHSLLGPGDPDDLPLVQGKEVGVNDIGLVEDHDFARLDPGAELRRVGAVVAFARGFDHDEAGQQGARIEPHVAFDGGLAPAVPGPIDAVGHQADRGGIDQIDELLEAVAVAPPVAPAKARCEGVEMIEGLPKQPLGQGGIARAVGMGKGVARRGPGPADGLKLPGDEAQRVAHIVEAQRVGQLRVNQRDQMTPRRERAGLENRTRLPRQPRHPMRRNKFANLAQRGK